MRAVSRPEPSATPMPTITVRTRPSGGKRTKFFSIDSNSQRDALAGDEVLRGDDQLAGAGVGRLDPEARRHPGQQDHRQREQGEDRGRVRQGVADHLDAVEQPQQQAAAAVGSLGFVTFTFPRGPPPHGRRGSGEYSAARLVAVARVGAAPAGRHFYDRGA